MRLLALCVAALIGCGGGDLAPPITPQERAQRFDYVFHATAALVTKEGHVYCTAVFYRDQLITADHCVDDKDIVDVAVYADVNSRGEITPGDADVYEVARRLPEQDLALLAPVIARKPHTSLRLAARGPLGGERVFVIGHARGRAYHLTEGRVSPVLHRGTPWSEVAMWFSTSAPVSPGNSGGPCLTEDGELLGITSFRSEAHLGGFIHPDAIRSLLGIKGEL